MKILYRRSIHLVDPEIWKHWKWLFSLLITYIYSKVMLTIMSIFQELIKGDLEQKWWGRVLVSNTDKQRRMIIRYSRVRSLCWSKNSIFDSMIYLPLTVSSISEAGNCAELIFWRQVNHRLELNLEFSFPHKHLASIFLVLDQRDE